MEYLPKNKKKTLWLVTVLIISVGGIIYFGFFVGTGEGAVLTSDLVVHQVTPLPEEDDAFTAQGGGETITQGRGGLLPYGSRISTEVLESESFQRLQAPPEFSVSEEELGREDLFGETE